MVLVRILAKFNHILSRHQKIRILELAVLMIIAGFLETLSVSLIVPFMNIIMNPQEVMEHPWVKWICSRLGIGEYRTFLVFLALMMAAIYLIKNIFLLFQMTIQNRFVYNNMFYTQRRLLRSYLLRPYEYFLGVKSGEVLRVIGSDTSEAFTILTSVLTLFSELIVSVSLLGTVLVIAPLMTLSIGVFLLLFMLVIQKGIQPFLRNAGELHQASYAKMSQWMLQSVQGIKEVKIMRREEQFEEHFAREGKAYARTIYQRMTYSAIPRFMIEALAMCAFFVAVAVMIFNGVSFASILPVVSGIAMASIRLLPSVNRISSSLAGVTFGEPAVNKLYENLQAVISYEKETGLDALSKKAVKESSGDDTMLTYEADLSGIVYRYPSGHENILDHANMKILKGQSVGIVGASGAGKTTAVDILLGLLIPQKGEVLVDGTDIRLNMGNWLSQIGYIPQTIFMLDADIRTNVAFGLDRNEIEDTRIWSALKEASLDEFVRSLPEGLDTEIGERGIRLSGGQRQRIGIARALYENPEILVFDEATSALDNDTEAAIMESIAHLKGTKTMVIIAHRLSTIENCDIVYRVENGKIFKELR